MMAAMGIVQPIVQPGGAPNTGQLLQPAVSATMQLNLQSDVAEQQITEGDLAGLQNASTRLTSAWMEIQSCLPVAPTV